MDIRSPPLDLPTYEEDLSSPTPVPIEEAPSIPVGPAKQSGVLQLPIIEPRVGCRPDPTAVVDAALRVGPMGPVVTAGAVAPELLIAAL